MEVPIPMKRAMLIDCPWEDCGKLVPVTREERVRLKDVRCPHCKQWCEVHAIAGSGTRSVYTLWKKEQ